MITLIVLAFTTPALSAELDLTKVPGLKDSLARLNKTAGEADSELPPCHGHELMLAAAFPTPVPRTCPNAQALAEEAQAANRKIRDECADISSALEEQLLKGNACGREKELQTLIEVREKKTALAEDDIDFEHYETYLRKKLGEAEFAQPACIASSTLALQLRKKDSLLRNKHLGLARGVVSSSCEDPTASDWYLRFLRLGQDRAEAQNSARH